MKRELTAEQKEKRDARRAQFRGLWKQVAAMPLEQRVMLAAKYGFRTCEGHELSCANSMLIALQAPTASVLGGFRQWLKHGRAVRKGEHGCMIWVPTAHATTAIGATGQDTPAQADAEAVNDLHFIVGTLFDISQTTEVQAESEVAA